MSVPVEVEAYSGYKANERPRQFVAGGRVHPVATVEDRWYAPDAAFFRVRTERGERYCLRYDERNDEWRLDDARTGATETVPERGPSP